MGGPITIRDTVFSNNEAHIFGAIQLEDAYTVIDLERVEITGNTARAGLAAVWLGSGVTGAIRASNVSDNQAPGAFAAAFAGDGITGVTLSDTTILDNFAGNGWNPISCQYPFQEGGGNYQWPVARSGEGSDDPDALCSADVTVGYPPQRAAPATIAFSGVAERYTAGEWLEVRLSGDSVAAAALDLWAAVRIPDGTLLFLTGDAGAPLTTVPTPFQRGVEGDGGERLLLNLELPPGIAGEYTLYAIYNVAGRGIGDLASSQRSNLASHRFRIDE